MSDLLGTVYNSPEQGYVRYDFNNALFKYTNMSNSRNWGIFGSSLDTNFTFYIKNCNYIRFINLTDGSCGVSDVFVNDTKIDKIYYSNFNSIGKTNGYNTVCCELYLTNKYSKITITNTVAKQMNFTAIDVLEGAELVTEEEYLDAVSISFLIKKDSKYYTIENDTLTEVEDYVTNLNSNVNCIKNLESIISFVNTSELSGEWKIITSKDFKMNINGIKKHTGFVVSKHVKPLIFAENIDKITANANGNSKFVISFDNGETWKTYTDSWTSLNNTFIKKNVLTSEESALNDLFIEEIRDAGITNEVLETLDFNEFKDGNIEFAFVIYDYSQLSKVEITYDLANSYKMLDSNDVEIQKVLGRFIKVIPKRDIDNAILEVMTTGIVE